MSKFKAAEALCFIFDDDEAGEKSSDELSDNCDFSEGEEEEGEDVVCENNDEEENGKVDMTKNQTIPPSDTAMSCSISIDSFKPASYIPSTQSLMSIAPSTFSSVTPKEKESVKEISTAQFFPVRTSNNSSCVASSSKNLGSFLNYYLK
jgi:hypothetical protein